jgi:hypothetical protein
VSSSSEVLPLGCLGFVGEERERLDGNNLAYPSRFWLQTYMARGPTHGRQKLSLILGTENRKPI